MRPWQGGGNMIEDVTFERTRMTQCRSASRQVRATLPMPWDSVWSSITSPGSAWERIAESEHQLLRYATRLLKEIPGLRLIGTASDKAGVLSFCTRWPSDRGYRSNAEPGRLRLRDGSRQQAASATLPMRT